MFYRSAYEARNLVDQVLRDDENVLSYCVSEPVERQWYHSMPNTVTTAYLCATNARLMRMSASSRGIKSIRWKFFNSLEVDRKRLKSTLALSFSQPSWSEPIRYPAEFISKDMAKVIDGIKSGSIPILDIPDENIAAIRVSDLTVSQLAAYACPEPTGNPNQLICSFCGSWVGECLEDGSAKFFDECAGCLRHFSHVEGVEWTFESLCKGLRTAP